MDADALTGRRVAEHLLEHGWITAAQVDEAQRTQSFFGGRIDSHLLRLGYVSEPVLGEALTEIAGVPFASWEHLRTAPANALEAIPVQLVERLRVCPFRLEQGRLRVATTNPRDAAALREIHAAVGHEIEPWVTTEPRLYQALERHYRLRFEGKRGIRLAADTLRPAPRSRGETEAAPDPAPKEPEIGLDGRPMDAQFEIDDFVRKPAETAQAHAPQATSLDALDESLAAARDRDEIAEALFTFAGSRSSRSGLFAVAKDGIRGVAGRGRAFATDRLRSVVVPAGQGTVFDTALKSRDFYFGVVPALPANRDLYTALGGRLPATVMILPIVVKDRTVALLYLDGDDGPLLAPDIPLMRRVALKAGLAFEMLLLRNKLRDV